ncbi:putative spermidine/putrescine transport system permease protein [Mesorhizobium soli]|uniref:ABC transporter permease n=1 Tax=Pseudaminobacter soli (ex Li et al. 2025) TaxID=1295366 RepID=UPI002475A540|nr:ABC transporter permease [Mesorhizobium soli]MDH6233786.1 putative spermidine/putrescine transport system permease protein [Mesorhizobium soli]
MVWPSRVYWILLAPLPLFLAVTYVMPFLMVAGWSVTDPQPGFAQYGRVLGDPTVLGVLLRTMRIGIVATAVSVTLGYAVAYNWVFGPLWRQRLIEYCVLIPFWISVLIRAFGWLILLRSNGLVNEGLADLGLIDEPLALVRNEFGTIIGMVHFLIPFAVFPIASALRQIDVRILQAASGLGAGRMRIFWQVTLPMAMTGVVGAAIIVFVFALGFFITPAILGGGRSVMVAEFIYLQLFQTVNWGLAAAMSMVLLIFISVLGLGLRKAMRIDKLVGR